MACPTSCALSARYQIARPSEDIKNIFDDHPSLAPLFSTAVMIWCGKTGTEELHRHQFIQEFIVYISLTQIQPPCFRWMGMITPPLPHAFESTLKIRIHWWHKKQ